MERYDAIVVGSGPNGLTAACILARAGLEVLLIEGNKELGGGTSSAELTLPGFRHDRGSAVHPFGIASPIFRLLQLERFGLRWIQPELPVVHPLDGGQAAYIQRSLRATAAQLGRDGAAYYRLFAPLVRSWEQIAPLVLNPLRFPAYPISAARFGMRSILPATLLARLLFRSEKAAALLAGLGAHSMLPLEAPFSSAPALVLGSLAHTVGWPIPQGGAGSIANALVNCFRSHGGKVITGQWIRHLDELPPHKAVLFDLTPRQFLQIAGDYLPNSYRERLEAYRYGPGVFKIDYALDGPIPWQAEDCRRSATVHLGGSMAEIAAAERAPHQQEHATRPYVLLAQPSLFDASRAPEGKHTAWAYCHVPNGSNQDMTFAIEEQIERFAPGFRSRILARSISSCADLETWNPNLIGGDIGGGIADWQQLFARPVLKLHPQRTSLPLVYLCSSSTPPGPGVHGMCGYHAAKLALSDLQKH
jgi:phytoene dehydrogenase-like protein